MNLPQWIVPPHKHSANGRTYYYDGCGLMPLLVVKDDGEVYYGMAMKGRYSPEVEARLIGIADKRTYIDNPRHRLS